MDNKKFYWSANGSELPEIEPHTKAKHKILEEYLERYLVTLCGNNIGKRKTITIIDGFCGGGMYLDPDDNNALWAGSPIRIIKTVDKALNIVRREKAKPDYQLDTRFIFIDNEKRHINCLKIQLEQSGLGHYLKDTEKCKFITGEFEEHIEECINEVRQRRGSSFFFLDPKGWSDVSMDSIRRIISLRKSEILYTYIVEDVIRFLSEKNQTKAYKSILEVEGYYESIDSYLSGSSAKHRYIKDETLRLFRERGQAPFVYSFALFRNKTQLKYYLIHCINEQVGEQELEVFRKGKITKAKNLKTGDFIIRKKYKQLHFMNKLFRNM